MNWHYFIAYGPWTDSVSGENFVVCRCPAKADGGAAGQWSKKLMPALHRHLKRWFGVKIGDWNVDSATEEIWRSKRHTSYEWTGDDWKMCNFADKEKP